MATWDEGMEATGMNQLSLSQSPAPTDPDRSVCDRQGLAAVSLRAAKGLTRSSYLDGPQREAPQSRFVNLGSADPTRSSREF